MTRRVRIPADVDRPDQLLAGLTGRQLVILAVPAVALWTAYLAVRVWVPLPVFAAIATSVAVVAVMVAVGRRDGLSADRFALAAWRHLRAPRWLVPAPDGIPPAPPDVVRDVPTPSSPAPLTLPVRQVTGEAVVDLGRDGAAVLLACTASDLALWTAEEQDAAVAAFGRWCNAITGPVQLVVSAEPANLATLTGRLVAAAPGLPHPALEAAAREHAAFLTSLAARHTVVRRQVWLVLRDPSPLEIAAPVLARRADDAIAGLATAGVTARRIDASRTAEVVAHATGSPSRRALDNRVITAGGRS